MELVDFGWLDETQRAELEADEDDPFEAAGNTLQWRKKDRHVALRGDDGRLVASAGLVVAEVSAGAEDPVPVVGIGGVIVSKPNRGRGLSTQVIAAALDRAASMGPPIAMLFCHRNRAGLYERHGFTEIPPPVMVEQPGGRVEMPMVAMWRPLHEAVELPQGRLVLHGLPF